MRPTRRDGSPGRIHDRSTSLPAMQVLHGTGTLPLDDAPSVVTVGFFDGVHLGHQAVFRRVVAEAASRGVRSVAITFDRHPREVLSPGDQPRLLTTVERKATLIEAAGIDVLLVLPFDRDFSLVPAETFVAETLVEGRARRARRDGGQLHVRVQGARHDADAARPGRAVRPDRGGRPARRARRAHGVLDLDPRRARRGRPRVAPRGARAAVRARRRGRHRARPGQGPRVPDGQPPHVAPAAASGARDLRRASPSTAGADTAPRWTSARTPPSGSSRCTSRPSCSTSTAPTCPGSP